MGQPISVLETRSTSNPAVRRYEINRSLSGMGHERYEQPPSELRRRPVDELARRLFAAGGVQKIHINSSVITVTLSAGHDGTGLAEVVRELFLHYGDVPAEAMESPGADADKTPESLADPGDAPAAVSAADEAPAPDRPEPEEPAVDQDIPGVPDALTDETVAPDTTAGTTADASAAPVDGDAGPADPAPSEPGPDAAITSDDPAEPAGSEPGVESAGSEAALPAEVTAPGDARPADPGDRQAEPEEAPDTAVEDYASADDAEAEPRSG